MFGAGATAAELGDQGEFKKNRGVVASGPSAAGQVYLSSRGAMGEQWMGSY